MSLDHYSRPLWAVSEFVVSISSELYCYRRPRRREWMGISPVFARTDPHDLKKFLAIFVFVHGTALHHF